MFNQTEQIFALANLKSKWKDKIGELKYINSQSVDNFVSELESKQFEKELNTVENELVQDLKSFENINEKIPKLKYEYNINTATALKPIDYFNETSELYGDYSLLDLVVHNENMRTKQVHKFSDYKLDNECVQRINIYREFDTINKIWFHFEKSSEITPDDLELLSKTTVRLEIGGKRIIHKPFGMCMMENFIKDLDLFPEENTMRICLVDFETICEYGLPLICLTYCETKISIKYDDMSIKEYSPYIKFVIEGQYLLTETRKNLAQNSHEFPMIRSKRLGWDFHLGGFERFYPLSFDDKLETCSWITICFYVNSELLQLNRVGLSAGFDVEPMYWEEDELVIISFGDLTYCNIMLDPEFKNKEKFVKLLNNQIEYEDVRGVCLSEINFLKLLIDYNLDTQEKIRFDVFGCGFDLITLANGCIGTLEEW